MMSGTTLTSGDAHTSAADAATYVHPVAGTRRRLLVMSYHFPPDGAVGGLRWAGLSKYLARSGWEVHVVTAAGPLAHAAELGLHVHHVPRARTLNDTYLAWRRRRRAAPGAGPDAPEEEGPKMGGGFQPRLLKAVRRELSASLVFPDAGRGWTLRAARAARRLLRRIPFDAVVTSGPPHSVHLAGLLATLGRRTPHCMDMRDPWAAMMTKQWGKDLYDSHALRLLVPRMERLVVKRARLAIANTAEFAGSLSAAYPDLKVDLVPNGIDPERLPAPVDPDLEKLTLAYVGTLYAGRDLTPILRALQAFLTRRPEARQATSLQIAGSSTDEQAGRLRVQLSEFGLEDVVQLRGLVPASEAMALLNGSGLALVLAQDQHMQIPAKLYECMGLRVPTLVLAERSSAAFREALRLGAEALEPGDEQGIVALLDRLWSDPIQVRRAPAIPIDYAGLATQVATLLQSHVSGEPREP